MEAIKVIRDGMVVALLVREATRTEVRPCDGFTLWNTLKREEVSVAPRQGRTPVKRFTLAGSHPMDLS